MSSKNKLETHTYKPSKQKPPAMTCTINAMEPAAVIQSITRSSSQRSRKEKSPARNGYHHDRLGGLRL